MPTKHSPLPTQRALHPWQGAVMIAVLVGLVLALRPLSARAPAAAARALLTDCVEPDLSVARSGGGFGARAAVQARCADGSTRHVALVFDPTQDAWVAE
jgi:hypothetical protein